MKKIIIFTLLLTTFLYGSVFAQSEVMAWGNLTGLRQEGQLLEFESSLRVVDKGWTRITSTGKEKQSPKYDREGAFQTVNTKIGKLNFTQVVEDLTPTKVKITIDITSNADTLLEGVYFNLAIPQKYYSNGSISLGSKKLQVATLSDMSAKTSTNQIAIVGDKQQINLSSSTKFNSFVRKEDGIANIYVELLGQNIKNGQKVQKVFTLSASGEVDHSPVNVALDVKNPGRLFLGLGGNFRLQNPTTDYQVIDYCLDNMRVAYGRVEMPWSMWHVDENSDPIAVAKSGKINDHVAKSMRMAQRLDSIGMPIIVSAWSAPNWAIDGDPRQAYMFRDQGIYGYQLKSDKLNQIYESITSYLVYLKQEYGVEAFCFSFNESDLGINVRHTGQEHADFIKGLGQCMAKHGLSTKVLLGDNSDATTFDFILPALNDPSTHKYIGAVSFHSWRGCDDETLNKWASAAKQINLPLIVGEGSTDAAAHQYPDIFSEETFAFYEINLYIRLCAICQPLSILQWQLTSDYSVLIGDGVFRTTGPLRPIQRYWNLKQLSMTPKNSFAIPFTCDKETVNCAAFGNISRGEYTVHMVNNGAESPVTIKGIPEGVNTMAMYVTDKTRGMMCIANLKVIDGTVTLDLPAMSFVSLISK